MSILRSVVRNVLAASAGVACIPHPALAQSTVSASSSASAARDSTQLEEIVVTASRREVSVLEVPFNVAAVTGENLVDQGIRNIADLGSLVPGIHIVNQGQRNSSQIVARGLALESQGIAEIRGNSGGGAVSTYVGEVPLYVDLRLNDIQRVEVLLGPQGTLYGAGSLGGTIRYIVNKPDTTGTTGQVRGSVYGYSESGDVSYDIGGTINVPIVSDKLAVRASLDYLDDAGYMDAPYLVRELGVSQPDIVSGPERDANLYTKKGINAASNLSGRIALRYTPNDTIDATLTYFYQRAESDGRNSSGARGVLDTGKFDNPFRVIESSKRTNELVSLDVTADLGFAELTSATGYSKFDGLARRDQTDLLAISYASYRAFPSFVSYGDQQDNTDIFTQELRLVSKNEGPLTYITGLFYNDSDGDGTFIERSPGLSEWFGMPPENVIDYASAGRSSLSQFAAYGELTYEPIERLNFTVGARYYDYRQTSARGVDLPLLFGRPAPEITLTEGPKFNDNGALYKANVSYETAQGMLTYFTFSQGYRTGYSNNLELCSVNPRPPCAQPDEMEYLPDKTNNYELGIKGRFLDNRLTASAAVYYIDWQDPQIASRTLVGSTQITKNGKGAATKGIELSMDYRLSDSWRFAANYSHLQAELTADAPRFDSYRDPDTGQTVVVDGKKGDRLPSSPEDQAFVSIDYSRVLNADWNFRVLWSTSYTGDVLTSIGNRRRSITLPSYTSSNLTFTLQRDSYSIDLFIYNVFDEYIETAARQTPDYNLVLDGGDGRPVYYRSFTTEIAPPRQYGLRFTRNF